MKYKAIIFDMDGTIIDTNHIWKQATNNLIERRGVTVSNNLSDELSKQTNGLDLHQSCSIIKEKVGLDDHIDDLIHEKSQLASAIYEQEVRFMQGFLQFHKKASQYNLKMGIATNADDNTLHITNKKLNLKKLFGEHVYNISHVNNQSKPDPALYLHAANKLEIDPEQCIAIEDTSHGIKAAKGAGMFCIGINSAGIPETLEKANFIIDQYHEIDLKRLLKLSTS